MQNPNECFATIDAVTFAQDIHRRTLNLFDEEASGLEHHPYLADFLELARTYLGEGKAYRALAISVGNFVAGGKPVGMDETALRLGVAMEIYQASALVHDDLIDNSPTRRGHPSIHVAATRMLNDSNTGNAIAILIGDFLLSLNHVATTRALEFADMSVAKRVHTYMAQISAEVAWGQYLDVRTEHAPLDNPQRLQRDITDVIALKSGHYSVMRPLVLGALLRSPAPHLVKALETAGKSWGLAFQMRDDAIGIFGDAELTGKPTSTDIREGKRTVLLALTLQRANSRQLAALTRTLGNRDATDDDINIVRQIIRDTGAYDTHETIIEQYAKQGHAVVDSLDLSHEQSQALRLLGDLLVRRVH